MNRNDTQPHQTLFSHLTEWWFNCMSLKKLLLKTLPSQDRELLTDNNEPFNGSTCFCNPCEDSFKIFASSLL